MTDIVFLQMFHLMTGKQEVCPRPKTVDTINRNIIQNI